MKSNQKIKLLTYGMASLHSSRSRNMASWRESCFEYSEKPDCVFYEIRERVFCSFVEDEIPMIHEVGKENNDDGSVFNVIRIDIWEFTFSVDPLKYENTPEGTEQAKDDFRNHKLTGRFLTMNENLR